MVANGGFGADLPPLPTISAPRGPKTPPLTTISKARTGRSLAAIDVHSDTYLGHSGSGA
jgi:hypothetical protein